MEVFLPNATRLNFDENGDGKYSIDEILQAPSTLGINGLVSAYNGFVDTFFNPLGRIDEANREVGGTAFTVLNKGGANKIQNDVRETTAAIQRYIKETPNKEIAIDAATVLTEVEFYEGILGGVVTGGFVGKLNSLSKVKSSGKTITLYRGVNEHHPGFNNALKGKAKPRGGNASPLEHNTITTESPFTSWSTNPSVAENFALRPKGNGVVLEIEVPIEKIVESPDLKTVNLKQSPGTIVKEGEKLIKGNVKGAKVKNVGNN